MAKQSTDYFKLTKMGMAGAGKGISGPVPESYQGRDVTNMKPVGKKSGKKLGR